MPLRRRLVRAAIPALLPALAALSLASCATPSDPPGPRFPAPAARGSTEPIRFGELALGSMRRGMVIGRYIWALECWGPYGDVYWTTGRNLHENSTFAERFAETLTDAGFDVAGRPGGGWDPESDKKRARFAVRGDLREVRLDLCRHRHWLTGAQTGDSGTGNLRVDWSVFDAGTGRLVHRVTTTGVAHRDVGVPQGDIMLIEEAFATAAEALGADPGFRAAVSRGGAVASSPELVSSPGMPQVSSPRAGALTIVAPAPGHGFADDPTGWALKATVRVGQGRGVVIGAVDGQSVILTATPGVDATVAVRPAQGVTLDGSVMARDAPSGLALVRVPARLTALSARTGVPAVSEPVTAVVAGGDDTASGIVAALRPDPRAGFDLIQADLIQADLTGPEPAPGDALLDEAGNLLGLALASRPLAGPAAHGLAFFVPVGEALARMGAELTQAAPSREKPGLDASLDGDRRPPT